MTDASLLPILSMVMQQRQWPLPAPLATLARQLPPVASAGLEFPLGTEGPTDLQQRIRPGDEMVMLRTWLDTLSPPGGTSWSWLRAALDTGCFTTASDELWLELDALTQWSAGCPSPCLSVFLRLRDRGLDPAETVRALAAAFGLALTADTLHALNRCLLALPAQSRLSHLGLMLGRPGQPLRLIIDALPADSVGAFLTAAGRHDIAIERQHQADILSGLVDRFRLALTLGDRLEDQIGFECFVGGSVGDDPRWRAVFRRLTDQGRCLPDYPDRLADWPGPILPFQVEGGWPGPLIAQALAKGRERLGWLECRISHMKVGQGDQVKAYVGFLEQERGATPAGPALPSEPATAGPSLQGGMWQGALDFLLGQRTHTGWWLDYDGFREGISDEWVTAYVGCALLTAGAVPAASRAWTILSARTDERRGGWGWNLLQPADADSTIWALRLADGLGRLHDPAASRGLAFLDRHVGTNGAVCTYLESSHRTAVNPDWSLPHDCVTAAAAGLPQMAGRVLPALLAAQQADGCWAGYWWADPAYPTALATAALAGRTEPAAIQATRRAAAQALRRLTAEMPDDAFMLALLLRTARLAPDFTPLQQAECLDRLARLQRPDGSWPGRARMLISNAQRERIPATDRAGIFTTATVLSALGELTGPRTHQ